MSRFNISAQLADKIAHYATFPQNPVSLQQLAKFGQHPNQGTLLNAAAFLREELAIRLSLRVKDLESLPDGLSSMNSVRQVRGWYAESFQELVQFPSVSSLRVTGEMRSLLLNGSKGPVKGFPTATPNLADQPEWTVPGNSLGSAVTNGSAARLRIPIERRYFSPPPAHLAYPPEVHEYNDKFTRLLQRIKQRHDPTVTTIAQGVLEWKKRVGGDVGGRGVQAFLDRFYMSRIGIRFLIGQHIALNTLQPHPDYVGIICTRTNVQDVCHEAIENARFVCEEHYALYKGPPIQLLCPKDLHFPYVPGHLAHILFELLKNSLRAVVERHGVENEDDFPPIKVVVVEGKEDLTIKISDEGGGIPRSAMPQIWTYMYTTMSETQDMEAVAQNDFKAPMAGFGYGLPLSRLYARFFGGDMRLISMEGYGTDAYIHLNKLSSSREPLQ